jgi:hypothetical protein
MRRAFLLLSVPLLMGSGPCDDAPASSSPDAAAGSSGAGTTGASGAMGAAGTKGAAGTGGGTSCEDRFEPLVNTIALFQGEWLLDPSPTSGMCGNAVLMSFQPWTFNIADAPSDPNPTPGCPGYLLVRTPKVLENTACDAKPVCPSATSGYAFFVHPFPKNPRPNDVAVATFIFRADSQSGWQKTDQTVRVDPADPNHLNFDNIWYTRTGIASGTCFPEP